MRRIMTVALAAAVTIMLASCGSSSTTSSSTTSLESASAPATTSPTGVVTITAADVPAPTPLTPTIAADAPTRIVSLATGVGETLAALGVGDRVVGRDETSDVPEIHDAPVVTKAHATSAEKVLSLDPDLVIVDATTAPAEALTQIRDAGITVVEVPEAWTLNDIGPRTRAVAAAVGVSAADAETVIAEAMTSSSASPAASPPRVAFLYLRGTSAIYLVGGQGSGADALIAAAGSVDAGAEAGLAAFVPLTAESVATLDPDVILVMTKGLESVGGIDGLVGLPGVAQTKAGKDGRVVAVDDTLLLSFGPRTGNLVDALRAAIGTSAT
ncbi:MAG: ABC transporter substrate-binding protein [bacterium]|nr:ABC transporter substrate-binding protein [bacterium]